MSNASVSLVNNGGPLTFMDGGHARTVAHGAVFEADKATAEALLSSDSNVAIATDTGPVVGSAEVGVTDAAFEPAFAFESDVDFSKLNVGDLRSKLSSVGLPTGGKKPELANRMAAFQAGYEMGLKDGSKAGADSDAWARMSPSPGAPLDLSPTAPEPNSSEAEPGAPPPPEGGLTEENEQHNTGAPKEGDLTGAGDAVDKGAITLADLGKGGKTK